MPVLETYQRKVTETYTVTINGESIETTDEHPFFTVDNGWTCAKDLEAGDKVELSDGTSATVEDVERNELDEPVTVYNFNVMDYHTYYVGESEVLVHNQCDVADFEKHISKLSSEERVATVKEKARSVAKDNGLVKDSKISKMNGRDVYKNPKTGEYFSVDTQHGRFEHLNKKGKHFGEVDFNFNPTKNADSSGGHNLFR